MFKVNRRFEYTVSFRLKWLTVNSNRISIQTELQSLNVKPFNIELNWTRSSLPLTYMNMELLILPGSLFRKSLWSYNETCCISLFLCFYQTLKMVQLTKTNPKTLKSLNPSYPVTFPIFVLFYNYQKIVLC